MQHAAYFDPGALFGIDHERFFTDVVGLDLEFAKELSKYTEPLGENIMCIIVESIMLWIFRLGTKIPKTSEYFESKRKNHEWSAFIGPQIELYIPGTLVAAQNLKLMMDEETDTYFKFVVVL